MPCSVHYHLTRRIPPNALTRQLFSRTLCRRCVNGVASQQKLLHLTACSQIQPSSKAHEALKQPLGHRSQTIVVARSGVSGKRRLGPVDSPSSAKSSHHDGYDRVAPKRETWQVQKEAIASKFGSQGWNPRKRLSPDALEGIRALHAQFPDKFSTPVLADQFKVSAEAIRRILKSKWRPSDDEATSRRQRWDKRGERIWGQMVALGVKPPKKWREMGVGRTDED